MGAALVVLKLGEQGLYLRTTNNPARLTAMGRAGPEQANVWLDRELLAPCFQVDVVGTTGSGDCTIAGFLAGWLAGLSPEAVMTGAVGVGACNVEQADSVSGIPSWETVQARITAGWPRRPIDIELPGWRYNQALEILVGPADATQS
jgi:sugar/nucleoside kinase (ribokinase family)